MARLFNPRLAQNCLPVEWDEGWVKDHGPPLAALRLPAAQGSSSSGLWEFRPIDSALLKSAARPRLRYLSAQGAVPVLPTYPLHLEPHLVDVNVHPAKRECAFAKSRRSTGQWCALRDALTKIAPKGSGSEGGAEAPA